MDARETAEVKSEPGSYSVGVFNPLTLTVFRDFEIQTHPLLFLVSPNAIARVPHYKPAPREPNTSRCAGQRDTSRCSEHGYAGRSDTTGWAITGEYGLSVPTLGMRLSQGTLFPTWEHDEGQIGWLVVPRAGWLATFTNENDQALTFRVDAAVGFGRD